MLFGKEGFRKKNSGKFLIGYQLLGEYAQISLLKIGEEQPFTFSLTKDQEEYQLPLCLCRVPEERLWIIGKDAWEKKESFPESYVDHLLEAAYGGEEIRVEQDVYNPRALLALYIKKSFSLLSEILQPKQIAAIMFVVDNPDTVNIKALREMVEYLQLKQVEIMFMGKEESFFWYNLHTEPSLWNGKVMLYELEEERLNTYTLFTNKNTTPIVTMVQKQTVEEWKISPDQGANEKDALFLSCCKKDLGNTVSSVYLIGDGFLGDWYQESLKLLCKGRRVFRGNNLYTKGACQGLLQKLAPTKLSETYVYLGEDKLLYNVGMHLQRQGEDSYLAILNGGQSWFECKKEWEIILEGENRLVIKIIPLDGKEAREHIIKLSGLEMNKKRYTRIWLHAEMVSKNQLCIKAKERGFGQFYPSGDLCWEENIEL